MVSVSLPSDVFQAVAAAAQEAGLSTSQFIREVTVAKASPGQVGNPTCGGQGSSGSIVSYLSPRSTTCVRNADEPLKRFIAENAARLHHGAERREVFCRRNWAWLAYPTQAVVVV